MLIVDTTEETFFIHQKRQHNGCTFLHTVSHEILIKDRSSTFKQFLLAQTKIHLGKTYRYFLISLHDSSFFIFSVKHSFIDLSLPRWRNAATGHVILTLSVPTSHVLQTKDFSQVMTSWITFLSPLCCPSPHPIPYPWLMLCIVIRWSDNSLTFWNSWV